jgi:hypothetical protein
MSSHAEMRLVLREAFSKIIGREGTIAELQCLQAIASLESSYGTAWKPPGNGSNNLGAIQAGQSWNGETFQYTDTSPQPDGTNKPYVTKFRKYPTLVAGAEDLARVVYVNRSRDKLALAPAGKGETLGFSRGLRESGYYEGYGKTVEDRIANHHRAVVASIRAQALALKEPLPADIEALPEKPELLRLGSNGTAVEKLQTALNRHGAIPPLRADGDFGEVTRQAVIAFQRTAGLVDDGIVGTRTWDALEKPPS